MDGKAKAKRWLVWAGGVFLAYVGVGQLLHQVVFPCPPPDPATFPQAGDQLVSKSEGVEQRIHAIEDGLVHGTLVIGPHAEGPPRHFHEGFDEVFTVAEGTLRLEVGDQVLTLEAGQSHRIPAGVAHRPFNDGDERVVIGGDHAAIPQTFAACLVQLYSIMDERGAEGPGMMLQMSVIDPICDTHLADVPRPVMAFARVLLAPAARLAGYRNYYPERSLHPPGSADRSAMLGGPLER